jgi:proline racemase
MNANELADCLDMRVIYGLPLKEAATMLRQQQADLNKAVQVIESIANEQVELSHDKIKWQNQDHIRWCKEFLNERK